MATRMTLYLRGYGDDKRCACAFVALDGKRAAVPLRTCRQCDDTHE